MYLSSDLLLFDERYGGRKYRTAVPTFSVRSEMPLSSSSSVPAAASVTRTVMQQAKWVDNLVFRASYGHRKY